MVLLAKFHNLFPRDLDVYFFCHNYTATIHQPDEILSPDIVSDCYTLIIHKVHIFILHYVYAAGAYGSKYLILFLTDMSQQRIYELLKRFY